MDNALLKRRTQQRLFHFFPAIFMRFKVGGTFKKVSQSIFHNTRGRNCYLKSTSARIVKSYSIQRPADAVVSPYIFTEGEIGHCQLACWLLLIRAWHTRKGKTNFIERCVTRYNGTFRVLLVTLLLGSILKKHHSSPHDPLIIDKHLQHKFESLFTCQSCLRRYSTFAHLRWHEQPQPGLLVPLKALKP